MLAVRGFRAARTPLIRVQVRHNSSTNSLWSWFKRKDTKKETAAPVIKTKDLVKQLEQESKTGWEEEVETSAPVKDDKSEPESLASAGVVHLEVIGQPKEQVALSPEQLSQLGLTGYQLKEGECTPEEAAAALQTVASAVVGSMDGALDTLEKRLQLVKLFKQATGVRIPDLVISTVATPEGVASYLQKSLSSNFNYWEPNAIYLDAKDFEGSNVSVVDAQQVRKQRQQDMDELLSEAEKFVEQHDKEAFDKARS